MSTQVPIPGLPNNAGAIQDRGPICTAFTTSKPLQSWLSRKPMRLASRIVSYLLRTLTAQEGRSLLVCCHTLICPAFTTSKQLQNWLSRKPMRLAFNIVSYMLRTSTAQEGCSLLVCTHTCT